MSPEARVRDTVARVRALVRQLSAPDPAWLRLAADAEAHVAALQPSTNVLEPTGFDALARAQSDERDYPRTGAPPRRTRNTAADPGPRQTRGSNAARSAFSPEPARGARASAARRPAWERLVPGSDNGGGHAARGSADRDAYARTSRTTLPLSVAGTAPATHDARLPGAPIKAEAAAQERSRVGAGRVSDAAPVDLGRLADRVRARTAGATRDPESGPPASASRPTRALEHAAPQHREPARIALPISALPASTARAPVGLAHPASRSNVGSSAADLMMSDGSSSSTAPSASTDARYHGEAQSRSSAVAMRFLFDPFAQSSSGEPSDEVLGARVESLLREQARRHGVDLS